MARKSLDALERGSCDGCGATLPGWALYKPLRADEWKDAVCGACITAKVNAAVTVTPVVIPPWESEQGKYLKAQRNLALDGSLWAVMPGSPLTVACQAKWAAYRASLNRMTVDCLDPAAWVWPETPKNEYPATSTASTTSATATGTVKLSGAK